MKISFGHILSGGTLDTGSSNQGIDTVAHPAQGVFVIDFDVDFRDIPVVAVTPTTYPDGSAPFGASWVVEATRSQVTVKIQILNTGNPYDAPFNIIAVANG